MSQTRKVHKCVVCKKALPPRRKLYCSQRCNQKAYELRKNGQKKAVKRETKASIPVTCNHCKGTFWAKTRKAQFCSDSCRSLYCRYQKQAIPAALHDLLHVPLETAKDWLETKPLTHLKMTLAHAGAIYYHPLRAWLVLN